MPKAVQTKTSEPTSTAVQKEQKLRHLMRQMGHVLVAYSGGVDSSYLAWVANDELAKDALSVTGISPSVSEYQKQQAQNIASQFGFNYLAIHTDEFSDSNYTANPKNRCYFCKSELFKKLSALAKERSIDFVLDGANRDDRGDRRPGRKAAEEKNVRSPLDEVGLTKVEIRDLSYMKGIPTWDKPASPCLASRVAYGVPVTIERLSKIEKAENLLRDFGFVEFRVRDHGELARVEIAESELPNALNPDMFRRIRNGVKDFGFRFVTLDMAGFRSGSMND